MLDRELFRDMPLDVAQARAATLETAGARADFLKRWEVYGPSAALTAAPVAPVAPVEKRMAWNKPKPSEPSKKAKKSKAT